MTKSEFDTHVEGLCLRHHASVTGGRRTQQRNAAIGGAPMSAHVYVKGCPKRTGKAADLEPDAGTKFARDELAKDAQSLGMWTKVYDDHVHVHWRDA